MNPPPKHHNPKYHLIFGAIHPKSGMFLYHLISGCCISFLALVTSWNIYRTTKKIRARDIYIYRVCSNLADSAATIAWLVSWW